MDIATKEQKQMMLEKRCGFLSADATPEQIWQMFYHLACLFAKSQNLPSSLGCFIDTFLIRGNEMHCSDKEWIDFFRQQFSIYLLGKKRICCSLSEGDMIHDFLKSEYERLRREIEESEIPFHCENLTLWLASFELDFPWLLDEDMPQWSIG